MRRISSVVMVALLLVGMLALTFSIQPVNTAPETQLVLETDKAIYRLGESVITTITNIGNGTIQWVGRWPTPWDIFTFPENRCVFSPSPCFCLFEIAPGENVTYSWNQADLFTIPPVEPGMYGVRDNQAWELSAYFRIVDAEIIVPDDYSSIQKAINAASEGDTVFVREGTYYESIRINKSISLIGESRENTVVDWGASGNVIHVSRNSVNITGFTVIGGIPVQWVGVMLAYVSNCHISNINVSSESHGIVLSNSTSNTIEDSTCVLDYYYHSLKLSDHSNNNTIRNNTFSADLGAGIYIAGASRDNMIIDNLCTKSRHGIWLSNAMHNKIVNNTINLNHQYGIFVRSSYNNTIYGNCISSTWTVHGIHFDPLFPSESNVIYGNCFANRRGQAYANGSLNVWDNGYPSGGNFWRNYNGTDLDNDSIGDSPYMIDENNTDHYPLMKPLFWWNNADVNHDFKVDIYDIVLISDAYLSTPSDSDWNVHCDITEPYGIIDIYDVVLMCGCYGEEYTP